MRCEMTDVCSRVAPISSAITDLTLLSYGKSKWFRRGTGMIIGWLAMTGRLDIKYGHSHISQHMAKPGIPLWGQANPSVL